MTLRMKSLPTESKFQLLRNPSLRACYFSTQIKAHNDKTKLNQSLFHVYTGLQHERLYLQYNFMLNIAQQYCRPLRMSECSEKTKTN